MAYVLNPFCASCYGPMHVVRVHHPNGRTVDWPVCPVCLTCRHLDEADQPMEATAPAGRRHLRAVP